MRGVEDILFWKTPGIFHFFTLPLEIPDKTQLKPWIFRKIVLDLLEVPRPKTKTPGLEILHYFFLITLGNSTSFLINPCKFHMLFLWHPWKFQILKLPVWIFSGIAQEGEWMNEWMILLHSNTFSYIFTRGEINVCIRHALSISYLTKHKYVSI